VFIEIAEYLRCPEAHQDTFCVVAPAEMVGRMVVRGLVGCPVCRREYAIADGVVHFGPTASGESATSPAPAAEHGPARDPVAVAALLGLIGPGGLVVLIGSAVGLAGSLATLLEGVHFVGVNAPLGASTSSRLSLLVHPHRIPLRHSVARGVVLGAEASCEPWWTEGARVLLPGRRLVAIAERAGGEDLVQLASGAGLWVGEKRSRSSPPSR
jgi:hypothetical protein